MRISVCIVSWNVRDDLTRCLESLREASRGALVETIARFTPATDGVPEKSGSASVA